MSLAPASLPPQTVPAVMAEVSPDSPDAFEMLVGGPAIPAPKDSPTDSLVERVEKAMGHLSTGNHHQRKKKRTSQDVSLLEKAMPSPVCADVVRNACMHRIHAHFNVSMCPLPTLTLRQIVTKHDSSAACASCKIANESIHVMQS